MRRYRAGKSRKERRESRNESCKESESERRECRDCKTRERKEPAALPGLASRRWCRRSPRMRMVRIKDSLAGPGLERAGQEARVIIRESRSPPGTGRLAARCPRACRRACSSRRPRAALISHAVRYRMSKREHGLPPLAAGTVQPGKRQLSLKPRCRWSQGVPRRAGRRAQRKSEDTAAPRHGRRSARPMPMRGHRSRWASARSVEDAGASGEVVRGEVVGGLKEQVSAAGWRWSSACGGVGGEPSAAG